MTAHIVGGALVTGACLYAGWQRKQWYTRRRRTLSAFCHALTRMETELSACETDTWVLLGTLKQTPGELKHFFRRLCAQRENLEVFPLSQLWQQALYEDKLSLKTDELTLLNRVGQVLGRYDGKAQAFVISQIRHEAEHCLETARREEQQQGRLALLLSMTLGMSIVLLMS